MQTFDADQTFRYSEPAGDPMPIHLDEDFAKAMGLPGIIIHGLCTMAFTSHALLSQVRPHDPEPAEAACGAVCASPACPNENDDQLVLEHRRGVSTRFETTNDERPGKS